MMICKNNTSAVLTIKITATDVVTLKAGGFTDLLVGRTQQRLAGSTDLAEKIIAKKVIINNGVSDLGHLEALDLVRYQQAEIPLDEDGNLKSAITKAAPFNDASGFRTRLMGIKGVITDASPHIDIPITQERWINGVQLILKGHETGDSIDFITYDMTGLYAGVLYPQGVPAPVALDQFANTFYVAGDKNDQGPVISSYPARLLPGLVVRVKYNRTGTEPVQLFMNLFLHMRVVTQ